jgi:hypothetical protein
MSYPESLNTAPPANLKNVISSLVGSPNPLFFGVCLSCADILACPRVMPIADASPRILLSSGVGYRGKRWHDHNVQPRALAKARSRRVSKEGGGGFLLKHSLWLVFPSAKQPGCWQVQLIDLKNGKLLGDTQHQCLRNAFGAGGAGVPAAATGLSVKAAGEIAQKAVK